MNTIQKIQQSVREFLMAEEGFAGAEKALLLVASLALIVAISSSIKSSSHGTLKQVQKLLQAR